MAAAQNRQSTSIEFVVRPKEDLYLEGTLRKLPRVERDQRYPCQMQKNQTFSCLFRHYAKHNGLRKDDLVFSFVDELLPDQMPETVHLMPQDEIFVEHRKHVEVDDKKKVGIDSKAFSGQFLSLLENGAHSDVTFMVGDDEDEIKAHKAILSVRSAYFEAMFRPGGMSESSQAKVKIPDHDKASFKRMLEFIYTNNVKDLEASRSPQDIMTLLTMSSEFVLEDLRELCEQAAAHVLSLENIGKFMVLSQRDPNATYLRDMCRKFYVQNRSVLRKDAAFRLEIENSPELGLLILDANIDEDEGYVPASKRRRVTDLSGEHDLVPGQSSGANTIGSGNLSGPEQW